MFPGFGTIFSMAGSYNDFNMLQWSPVFARLVEGHALPYDYEINGHQYTKCYYIIDRIYPRWSTFVKRISSPLGPARSTLLHGRRFAVRMSRGNFVCYIVVYHALTWSQQKTSEVICTCVIMHNIVIKSERTYPPYDDCQGPLAAIDHQLPADFTDFTDFPVKHAEIRDTGAHTQVQTDLL
jgi:hypothetical protein